MTDVLDYPGDWVDIPQPTLIRASRQDVGSPDIIKTGAFAAIIIVALAVAGAIIISAMKK
jgi:hypothetical protein